MLVIKANTKKAEQMLRRANYNEGYYLTDVYGSVSPEKCIGWEWCLNECKKDNGYNFRICSHNSFSFSVAWDIVNPDTGEWIATKVKTSKNSYYIEVA